VGKHKSWLQCIDTTQTGNATGSALKWTYPLARHSMSTPAVAGGLVFAADSGRRVQLRGCGDGSAVLDARGEWRGLGLTARRGWQGVFCDPQRQPARLPGDAGENAPERSRFGRCDQRIAGGGERRALRDDHDASVRFPKRLGGSPSQGPATTSRLRRTSRGTVAPPFDPALVGRLADRDPLVLPGRGLFSSSASFSEPSTGDRGRRRGRRRKRGRGARARRISQPRSGSRQWAGEVFARDKGTSPPILQRPSTTLWSSVRHHPSRW